MERKLKINFNKGDKIESVVITGNEISLLIKDVKIGDTLLFKDIEYIVTGATSENGSFHHPTVELRGREFFKKKNKKLMVESRYLNDKTNQIFLIKR